MPRILAYRQLDKMDCGPTCLRIVSKYYGKSYSLQKLRDSSFITREGVSLLGISEAAESIGFRTMGIKVSFEQLSKDVPLPAIVHWKQNHFIVVYKITSKFVFVADPAVGKIKYSTEEFKKKWISTVSKDEEKGIALILEPTPEFYKEDTSEKINKKGFGFLFKYLSPNKKFIIQIVIGIFISSIIQLILPFLTQSIIDTGINNQDINFITLVLVAQLVLVFSQMSVDFIRSWILLHLSTRINISLVSDYLIKLMRLPMKFFDIKFLGDIIQRIDDQQRIQNFFTSSTLNVFFSSVHFIIFSIVLAIYNSWIFIIFIISSLLYFLWIRFFLKRRRILDHQRFEQMSKNRSGLIQLISGMQEIKLNNCETQKRWEWENIQARLFKVRVKGLSLVQYQQSGATFINEIKNVIITFLAAYAVIEGSMTLGMMLAVQYMIGQLNGPLLQLAGFMHLAQDAKISLERLGEVHDMEDEEELNKLKQITIEKEDVVLENVDFQYEGPKSKKVIDEISVIIPKNKVTAIVGSSGSGKTTLIKLLLGFYNPVSGNIKLDSTPLDSINVKSWRNSCGVVMQEGFIFSDTIANNIGVGDEEINKDKLLKAVKVANIEEFINSLPLRYNTIIGSEGHGLSQGQKQRILIARAVYKNPAYLFLDEATNALDANNEKVIIENLNTFFEGKTVVVVAHRLSTVKNADQIIVLEEGKIIEKGTHDELVAQRNAYYNLIKNQLELGN